MKSGPKSAEEYRATGLLCRQQAACDPDKGWQLLGEAERWEYLADQQSASDLKGCNFPPANVEGNKVWLSQKVSAITTMAFVSPERSEEDGGKKPGG